MVASTDSASDVLPLIAPIAPTATSGTMSSLSTSTTTAQAAVSTGTLYVVMGRLKDYSMNVVKERKPWAELLDRNFFSKPQNFAEATSRLRKNADYFKVNYLIIVMCILLVWMFLHPSTLLVLSALLVAWLYAFVIRQSPITIGGRTLSDREKLLGLSAISLITVFFSSVGTVIFSALALSFVVVALHGAMRTHDDLFIDPAESNQSFLSIFTAPASTTGPGNV